MNIIYKSSINPLIMEVSKNEDHLFQWGIGLVSSSCYPILPLVIGLVVWEELREN
jgi:hypothetical protein